MKRERRKGEGRYPLHRRCTDNLCHRMAKGNRGQRKLMWVLVWQENGCVQQKQQWRLCSCPHTSFSLFAHINTLLFLFRFFSFSFFPLLQSSSSNSLLPSFLHLIFHPFTPSLHRATPKHTYTYSSVFLQEASFSPTGNENRILFKGGGGCNGLLHPFHLPTFWWTRHSKGTRPHKVCRHHR